MRTLGEICVETRIWPLEKFRGPFATAHRKVSVQEVRGLARFACTEAQETQVTMTPEI